MNAIFSFVAALSLSLMSIGAATIDLDATTAALASNTGPTTLASIEASLRA
ncbi:hypothetical protein [Polymorphobacter fuscus]|uniref:hypothetical protein n=1 Tax=Sandarakinorhabdus fusca TaxID=1439888 RepID=UPI001296053C|nr:hypothetical protein [Polymorphobacter fuscus]NJC08644.1 hypothetical protein [Polymorphobacter fuscus]